MKQDDAISKTAFKRRAFNRMRANEDDLTEAERIRLRYLQQTSTFQGQPLELDRVTGGIRSKRKI